MSVVFIAKDVILKSLGNYLKKFTMFAVFVILFAEEGMEHRMYRDHRKKDNLVARQR
jgi:hypothetical protein